MERHGEKEDEEETAEEVTECESDSEGRTSAFDLFNFV